MKSLAIIMFLAACSHPAPPPPPPEQPKPVEPAPTPPPAPEPPAEAKPAPPPEPTPAEDTFIEKSKNDKLDIMKKQVMPAMAKAFKAHDGKRYAKFDCKTCHGKGAADQSFKMPNPDLPKLDFEALHSDKLDKKVAAMAEFMEKTVKPDMAKILGLTEFDPNNPKAGGFGCLTCHTQK